MTPEKKLLELKIKIKYLSDEINRLVKTDIERAFIVGMVQEILNNILKKGGE